MESTNDEECRIFDEGYGYDGPWCPCSRCQNALKNLKAKQLKAKQLKIQELKKDKIVHNTKQSKSIFCKVTPEDKEALTEYVMKWVKQYKGMKILFISLGASSWADGRATENSDYDLYIVYEGYDNEIQVSELKHETPSKIYEIDIQGHPREEFEKLIEQWEEIPIFNLEGARSNPEQLLIYLADEYGLYKKQTFDLGKLRKSFSKKISHTVGKGLNKSSKARHKFCNPESDDDYIKGIKCFYFAWKLTLYAIQLAKSENEHHIVDFYEPYAFWERLQQIPTEIIHSEKGYTACWEALNEFEFKAKFKEFQKLAPK